MATFADFPPQTMASNNDFTLYPYQEVWNQDQSYLPASSYADDAYLNTTTFDTYQTHPVYVQPDQFSYGADQSFQTKNNLQPPSPNYSPAHSNSHSFDLHPPILSSTSDSGASVQSTISSAMGSPSAQPQQSNDWTQQQSASMFPGIVHPDSLGHDVFATTGFDLETIPITDKGCVGELTAISSSESLKSAASFNFSLFPTSYDLLHPSQPYLQAPRDGVWSQSFNAQTTTGADRSLSIASTVTPQPSSSVENVSPNDSVFRSPTTPASATSPVLERVKGKRTSSVTPPAPKRARGSSPLTQAMSYHENDLPSRPQAPTPTFTSPFFSQSSGNYVPPLELSCPSPLLRSFTSSYLSFLIFFIYRLREHCANKSITDPALIQPTFSPTQFPATYPEMQAVQSPQNMIFNQPQSPVPSRNSIQSPHQSSGKIPGSASPYLRTQSYQPYPTFNGSRRPSISSVHSRNSQGSLSSEDSNKGLCPIPTCGRHVKDLKAHMLTHQNERPEKCPIPTCEYHTKGFARKYDKNRHTLTHYKGTMVCGFCPGSGSAAEKSFNRADVFKRHLTSVHQVEQTPPNARRKSPAAASSRKGYSREVSGMCSTCGVTFASAQEFYEHLDDCVLRVVQQADPSEAINEKLLTSVAEDQQVQETMEKHMLPTTVDYSAPTSFDEDEDAEEDKDVEEEDANDGTYGSRSGQSGKGAIRSRKTGNSS